MPYGLYYKNEDFYRKFRSEFTGHFLKIENRTVTPCDFYKAFTGHFTENENPAVKLQKNYGSFLENWKSYRNWIEKITGQIKKIKNLNVNDIYHIL